MGEFGEAFEDAEQVRFPRATQDLHIASATLRAEWTEPHQLIRRDERLAEEPHVTPMSLMQYTDFLGQSSSLPRLRPS